MAHVLMTSCAGEGLLIKNDCGTKVDVSPHTIESRFGQAGRDPWVRLQGGKRDLLREGVCW